MARAVKYLNTRIPSLWPFKVFLLKYQIHINVMNMSYRKGDNQKDYCNPMVDLRCTLPTMTVLGFYVLPTAKVIRRRDLQRSNSRSLINKSNLPLPVRHGVSPMMTIFLMKYQHSPVKELIITKSQLPITRRHVRRQILL